jgi:hypothetical protein
MCVDMYCATLEMCALQQTVFATDVVEAVAVAVKLLVMIGKMYPLQQWV